MGGRRAPHAEVLGCGDDSLTKNLSPETIHGDAGGERIFGVDEPSGEAEAVGRQVRVEGVEHIGVPGSTGSPGLV